MKIYIASKNEKKIALSRELIKKLLSNNVEVLGCPAKSNVSDTPWEEQTYQGAKNRANNSLKENPDADFGMGIETGLINRYGQIFEETWCCIVNRNNKEFWGYASGNIIPNDTRKRVNEDKKTGIKTLEVFDSKTRSWITFSGNLKIREVCLTNAIKEALTQLTESSNFRLIK